MVVDGFKVSEREVKDLNRARAYLRAMATKYQVDVHDDIGQATTSLCKLVRM